MEWYNITMLAILGIFIIVMIIMISAVGICTDDNRLFINLNASEFDKESDYMKVRETGNYIMKAEGLELIIARWRISGMGLVPRWYKSSKLLDKRAKVLGVLDYKYVKVFGNKAV